MTGIPDDATRTGIWAEAPSPSPTKPWRAPMTDVIACGTGCCPGCQDCYGMSIGCHQEPCRCGLPCTCRWGDEDKDPKWRDGCERHDDSSDARNRWIEPDYDEPVDSLTEYPCPECGATGACGYDDEGRPMIHTLEFTVEES